MIKNLLKSCFLSLVVLSILICSPFSADSCNGMEATKIFYNGKIFTSDTNNLWAEAVAIHDNIIIGVGSDEDILGEYQGGGTELINLQSHTMIPGLNDAHTHLLPYLHPTQGMFINDPYEYVPGPGPTCTEMLGLVSYLDTIVPKTTWFFGIVGRAFVEENSVDRFILESVAPDRPVLLFSWPGHFAVMNTTFMNAVGILENQPDIFGGAYYRVPGTDIIDGRLQEYAIYDVAKRVRDMVPDEVFQAQLTQLIAGCNQMGYTSIQDVPIGFTNERYENILNGLGDITIRYRNIAFPFSLDEAYSVFNNYYTFTNPFSKVRSGGIKLISDGTPQEWGMNLSEEYADKPGCFGTFNFTQDELNGMVCDFLFNWNLFQKQYEFHTQGDQALQNVLDSMNSIACDDIWRVKRPRIVHGELIRPDQYQDLSDKGITFMKIPNQFIKAQLFYDRVGPVRYQNVQPLKSLLDNNINVALCSDTLGSAGNPFLDIKLAAYHPANPTESITVEQAVICYTLGGARAEFMDLLKGSIKVGKLADFAVLSQDIFDYTVHPTMENTVSILTVLNGDVVWDANLL